MGVDAVIKLATPPSFEDYDRLVERFRLIWPVELELSNGTRYPRLDPDGQVRTSWRYYGPGYERGPWPEIRRMIEWLWTETWDEVRYGGDHTEDVPIITGADVEAIQAHYDEYGHEPYRQRWKAPR
jgi:hypothetical protein